MKRGLGLALGFVLLLAGLVCLDQRPSRAYWQSIQQVGVNTGGRSCTDGTNSANFLARTSGLSNGQKDAYCVLINGLDTDGLFTLGDQLLVYAAPDATTATLNLLSSTLAPTMSVSGAPTFTANAGYANSGSSKINTGLNASTSGGQYSTTEASAFVFTLDSWTGVTDSGAVAGFVTNSSTVFDMYPHFSDGNFYVSTQNIVGSLVSYTAGTHMLGFAKSGAINSFVYMNGSGGAATAGNGASALVNDNFLILGDNAAGLRSYNGTVAASWFGGYLTPTQEANLYSRLCTYLTTVHGSC